MEGNLAAYSCKVDGLEGKELVQNMEKFGRCNFIHWQVTAH